MNMGQLARITPGGRILAALILAALGLLSWWWLDRQRAETPEVERPRQPDSYFRRLDTVQHDVEGRPETRVTADYAEHFEDEPWIHLHALVARGIAPDSPPWRMTARRGRMSDDGVELDAWDDVVLLRGAEDGDPLRMETDSLHINTETEFAATDAVVVVSQGASRIRGRGMRASLRDEHLRLEHDVEAYYEK